MNKPIRIKLLLMLCLLFSTMLPGGTPLNYEEEKEFFYGAVSSEAMSVQGAAAGIQDNDTDILPSDQRNNDRRNVLIICGFVILMILIMIYRDFTHIRKERQTKRQLAQQEQLSKAVIEAEEIERSRIVSELHDDVGQQLSAAKLSISALQAFLKTTSDTDKLMLQNAADLLDDSVKKVRTVSRSIIPNSLVRSGLASAVNELTEKINASGKAKIELQMLGVIGRRDPIKEIILFRVLQEVINNAVRHSTSTEISVQLIKHEHELSILVEDRGEGFDIEEARKNGTGIGLKNIESRVAFLDGRIFYDSNLQRGTIVSIEIPM